MMKTSMFLGAIAIAVSGCSSISPAGMVAVSRLDPLETAPSDLSVAVSVSNQMHLRDGDAKLYLAFEPDKASVPPVAVSVPLSIIETDDIPRPPSDGRLIYTFAFSPEDAAQLAITQTQIKNLRAQGIEGEGTLSIGVEGGCLTGDLNGLLPIATWIKTSPQASFVSLTRETDLFAALSEEDRLALNAALVPC
ncbi:MAG: hypothetical protein AAF234_20110 [Pseudomonadota bacterium]